jgi:DNA polymerase III epsilon subunit-like protein
VIVTGADDASLHITGAASFYIRTDPATISPEAQAVHRIDADKLANGIEPVTACLLIAGMVEALRPEKIVAHNAAFDRSVIGAMFCREGREKTFGYAVENTDSSRWHCTMLANKDLLRLPGKYGWKWPTLSETYNYYFPGQIINDAHDSLSDSLATARVFIEQRKRAKLDTNDRPRVAKTGHSTPKRVPVSSGGTIVANSGKD